MPGITDSARLGAEPSDARQIRKQDHMKALSKIALASTVILGLTFSASTASASESDADTGATIRELAEEAGILFGSGSVKGAEWTHDGRPSNYLAEPKFAEVLAEQFNSLSPENELKWMFVEPQQGVFDFEGLDRLVDFAEANDMQVKGHGFLSQCCHPAFVADITEPDEMRAAIKGYFEAVMHRYQGRMDRYDVVAEPLETQGTAIAQTDIYRILGPGYIADAFRIAHAADPEAKLFLNENLVEFLPAKRQALYDLVSGLVEDGVPIDGVALQMHETFAGPAPGVITEMVNSYRDLGLEVSIAELDVHTYDPIDQGKIYGDVVAEALAAGITEISTWGFTDKHLWTWLPGAKPLMFDEEYNPKPAYFAVRDALQSFVYNDRAPGKATLSNTSGHAYGLHDGNYTVTMNLWHGTPGSYYRLYENDVLVDAKPLNAVDVASQTAESVFTGKPNGTYTYRAELINSKGVTQTTTTTVKVKDAAPGRPVVSTDNWDKDGDFTVTANLWWGTNATSYAFYLDGNKVGEGDLTANTPETQTATLQLTGVAQGTHTINVTFTNANGSTESKLLAVKVK